MKRTLFLIFVLIIVCIAAIYAFVPAHITISNTARSYTISKNIADCVRDAQALRRWWPGSTSNASNRNEFVFGNYSYQLVQPFTDGAELQVSNGAKKFETRIFILPLANDSSIVEWQTLLTAGYNPIKRVANWLAAKGIKDNIRQVLNALINFAANTKNIYGFPIVRTTFTDTTLAATKFSSNGYPTTDLIYKAIDRLKKKFKEAGAIEKDFPMLNIRQTDTDRFETMIAICVNKEIIKDENIFVIRMVPMKDRFLKTDVTGGPLIIKNAHEAIKKYMEDRFLSAPAIPFEILVTDRREQTDTSKWKTTIFHPSM